ncbi:dihydrofolate reductase family protein [Ramlibacter albus]|uniref:Dihydrofolate reductase n=1 Tax=Ramlibacter albus TaxID=2079448 RepID=A0A923S639_9BURK|nr:dihydrofolate reductase family protein [Ramlibacter albus]MBC5765772.1 dihydrofolate reductase [Ramlibacter albus]
MAVRVCCFGVSLDGYSAGPNQGLQNALGENFFDVMKWMFPTRMWHTLYGQGPAETGKDNMMAERGFENIGSWVMGRNMFGPVRGPWPDDEWKGWWGEEPPYHCDVFVLTHHARPPLEMKGGTTFHFVTDGIHAALNRAKQAAAGKDVRIGGGAATVRQYLQARLIDEAHLALGPVLIGAGESLFSGIDLRELGYEVAETIPGERATHIVLRRK